MVLPLTLVERPRVRRAAAAVLLSLMAVLMVLSSRHKRLSYDEADNLSYGHRFLTKGPGVQPLGQRMPVLVLNALGCVAEGCEPALLDQSEGRRLLVRAGTMVFALALGSLVYLWASEMAGPAVGLASLWVYAFDPTVLAHGKQVTSDVAVAFFMTAAVYALWRMEHRPGPVPLLAAAIATAGAVVSKFTGLLLAPILAIVFLALGLAKARAGTRPTGASVARSAAAFAVFVLVVLLGINAAYGFEGTLRAASDHHWRSAAFQAKATWPVPIPLPRAFVQGLDYSSYLQENPLLARGNNYVLGALNRDGRWYAFPLMLLLKTPLAVFALAGIALFRPPNARALASLVVPPLVVVGFFSVAVQPQLGIRYILPALPFLHLLAGHAVHGRGGWRGRLVPLLLMWQALSTLSYHPHYVAYFNELIGRRVNAYRWLADSNLDWEDHAWFVRRFLARHPEMNVAVDPDGPRAGYVLVGANDLVGIFDPERYRWLREGFRPVGHVAYSHLLFHVPPERVPTPSPANGR